MLKIGVQKVRWRMVLSDNFEIRQRKPLTSNKLQVEEGSTQRCTIDHWCVLER